MCHVGLLSGLLIVDAAQVCSAGILYNAIVIAGFLGKKLPLLIIMIKIIEHYI